MTFRCAPWVRSAYEPSPSIARAEFFVFFNEEPDDGGRVPMEVTGWSPYDTWPPTVGVTFQDAESNPDFFASFRALASEMTNVDGGSAANEVAVLANATYCARVEAVAQDPPDLGYLQFAWATVRLLMELGGHVVCDSASARWYGRQAVLSWARDIAGAVLPFSIDREVRFDTDEHRGSVIISTGGMAKFGRPDVFVFESNDVALEWIARGVRGLAMQMAMGRVVAPDDTVSIEGRTYRCERADGEAVGDVPVDVGDLVLRPSPT